MRVGLVGCVREKKRIPSPAGELYTSPLFRGRCAYVKLSCERWFILSALHGLLAPEDVIDAYDMTLKDSSAAERRSWSQRVLNDLDAQLGGLGGHTLEVHAGEEYCEYGLVEGLRRVGAQVERPAEGLPMGKLPRPRPRGLHERQIDESASTGQAFEQWVQSVRGSYH